MLEKNEKSNEGDFQFEEHFKQLYEIDQDESRKPFLDDLFTFMQNKGIMVNHMVGNYSFKDNCWHGFQ